jgi:hypothetical protein
MASQQHFEEIGGVLAVQRVCAAVCIACDAPASSDALARRRRSCIVRSPWVEANCDDEGSELIGTGTIF